MARRFNWLSVLDVLVVLGIPAWVWAYFWYGLDVWFIAAGILALVAYLTMRLGRHQLRRRHHADEAQDTTTVAPSFDRLEEVLNWTLPGLTLYFRDANLAPAVIEMYQPGLIFRAKAFVDVSGIAGKPTKNTRFAIASSKAAPLYQVNPDTEKWRLHTLNCNSYFKVLDVTEREGVSHILLLHIPYAGVPIFQQSVLTLHDEDVEQRIIERARDTLEQKWSVPENETLEEPEWIRRTRFPIGLSEDHAFFPLTPTNPIAAMAKPLHDAIRNMTNDLSDVNDPFAPGASPLD